MPDRRRRSTSRPRPRNRSGLQRPELASLFDETVALYLRLSAVSGSIYRRGDLSGPRRTLLLIMARTGPQTVAALGRIRSQSRQRIQLLVDALTGEGLLARVDNPAHKRSPLVVLTPRGHAAVRDIVEREGALRSRLRLTIPPAQLARAAEVLREIRTALERQMDALIRDMRTRRR